MRSKVEKERYKNGLNKVICDQDCDVGSLLLCVDVWLEWSDVVSPTAVPTTTDLVYTGPGNS